MDQQLSLFSTPEPLPLKYNLFLAILPDVYTAERISELARELSAKHGLRGRLRPLHHLHVTLHHLGHYADVPENVVRTVDLACETVAAATTSFDVKFDTVLSFRNRPGNHPFVLSNSHGIPDLMSFHQALVRELAKQGFPGGVNSKFVPHVTMLYDKQSIPEEPIDPISWRVSEIVLVRSEVGATKYQHLGRWALRS
jgi:RNA 2',3'-cyclic 3'-phosphodiesterase